MKAGVVSPHSDIFVVQDWVRIQGKGGGRGSDAGQFTRHRVPCGSPGHWGRSLSGYAAVQEYMINQPSAPDGS